MTQQKPSVELVLRLAKEAGLLEYRSAHDEKLAFTFPMGNTSVLHLTKLIELALNEGARIEWEECAKISDCYNMPDCDGWTATCISKLIRNREDNL